MWFLSRLELELCLHGGNFLPPARKKRYQMTFNRKIELNALKFSLWTIVLSLPPPSGEKSWTVVAGKLGDGTPNFF